MSFDTWFAAFAVLGSLGITLAIAVIVAMVQERRRRTKSNA